jgi:hypothetical protein
MTSESDASRLKKVTEYASSSVLVDDGGLDSIPNEQIDSHVASMAQKSPCWQVIVKTTEERPKAWWLRGMMTYFKSGLSLMELEDGRLSISTWSAAR